MADLPNNNGGNRDSDLINTRQARQAGTAHWPASTDPTPPNDAVGLLLALVVAAFVVTVARCAGVAWSGFPTAAAVAEMCTAV